MSASSDPLQRAAAVGGLACRCGCLADLVFSPAKLTSAQLAVTADDLAGVRMGDVGRYHPGWVYHGLIVGTAVDAAQVLRGLFEGDLVKPMTLPECLILGRFRNFAVSFIPIQHTD